MPVNQGGLLKKSGFRRGGESMSTIKAPGSLILEDARITDVPALVRIISDGRMSGEAESYTPDNAAAYDSAFRAIVSEPGAFVLVAREAPDGTPLGLAQAQAFRTFKDEGRPRLVLHSLFVAPEARGRSIGAALLRAVEARGRADGATRVNLLSHRTRLDAHRFYRANGYEQGHEGFWKAI
jgi:GNAT superfamily N-acetyltransferase